MDESPPKGQNSDQNFPPCGLVGCCEARLPALATKFRHSAEDRETDLHGFSFHNSTKPPSATLQVEDHGEILFVPIGYLLPA